MSYTTFAYSNLSVDKDGVTFTIKNTGDVEGTEIAQLYVGKQSETIFRPVRELKGFARVTLAPGEEKSVHIAFDDKTFRFYDTRTDTWEVESGNYQIMVGTDADTMVLEGSLKLPELWQTVVTAKRFYRSISAVRLRTWMTSSTENFTEEKSRMEAGAVRSR